MTNKNNCFECGNDSFKTIEVMETVKVKDLEISNTHMYHKCEKCGEMYEPFDNPDYNILSDYRIYREKKNLLQPEEIKEIRERYGLSQREFSKLLGLGHATISRIEGGVIQSDHHDILLRLASDPYAFLNKVVANRKTVISRDTILKLEENLNFLTLTSYKEHEEIARIAKKELYEQTNYLVKEINKLKFDFSMRTKTDIKKDEGKKWTSPKLLLQEFGLIK